MANLKDDLMVVSKANYPLSYFCINDLILIIAYVRKTLRRKFIF